MIGEGEGEGEGMGVSTELNCGGMMLANKKRAI